LWMVIINRRYGPVDYDNPGRRLSLDWRLPYCQSIYWALQGLEHVEDESHREVLGLRRLIYHNLQDLFRNGKLRLFVRSLPPEASERLSGQEILDGLYSDELPLYLGMDLRMFPVAYQATLDVIETRIEAGEEEPGGVIGGSIYLCREGIMSLYLAGYKDTARKYLKHLQERQPDNRDFQVTLEAFVAALIKEELELIGVKKAGELILSMLRAGYGYMAVMDDESALREKTHAQQTHQLYTREFRDDPGNRIQLPSFEQMRWTALVDFMNDGRVTVQAKQLLVRRLELENRPLHDKLIAELTAQQEPSNDTQEP